MKNRILPYGYCCKDGVIVIEPQESKVLKRIFAAYLDGSSMLTIAEQLNREKIEYRDGVTGWNKGRLKHLIDNTKYLGTEVYPPIIDQATYEKTQKTKHIGMGLEGEKSNDNSLDLQVRIAEIDAEFRKMLDRVSTETVEAFDEKTATRLMNEKSRLQQQLDNIADAEQRRENAKSRLDDIYTILDGIKNRPMEYDDQIVRQLLECIVVDSKEQVTVIFKGGLKSVQPLTE